MSELNLDQYLSYNGLVAYTAEIKAWVKSRGYITEDDAPKIVRVREKAALPSIGESKTIYVNTTTHQIYFWVEDELRYQTFGADPEDIKIINGGNSKLAFS